MAEQLRGEQPRTHAEDRDADRQQHGEERTEGEEEDDGRGQDADHLGEPGGRFLDTLDRLAAQLDLESTAFGVPREVDDVLHQLLGHGVRLFGEGDLRVRDRAVTADLRGAPFPSYGPATWPTPFIPAISSSTGWIRERTDAS